MKTIEFLTSTDEFEHVFATAIGDARIVVNGPDSLYLSGDFIVNGVSLHASLHVKQDRTGMLLPDGRNPLYVSMRWNGKTHLDASPAQRTKIRTVLTEVANEFAMFNQELFTRKYRRDLAVERANKMFTDCEIAEAKRLKAYFPFRVVYLARMADGSLKQGAVTTMRVPNDLVRKGNYVVVLK